MALGLLAALPAIAQAPAEADDDLATLSIEQLMDVIVVTASRAEEPFTQAPATVTVLTADRIASIPADDYGDLLRLVPGLNVAQTSARDIVVTGRGATNTLSTRQLVLVDGRTVYLDFFGFVMWDLLPVDHREIRQIEVVHGPGSAVWGANAMSGVINLITKAPRETPGTSVVLSAGELSSVGAGISHSRHRERLGLRVSASYAEQDPYPRPTGFIPGSMRPYPTFANEGTRQPKLDLRFDWNPSPDTTWSFGAGHAATDGIVHTGTGPFDVDSGTSLSHARASWQRHGKSVTAFINRLDGDAANLLTRGLDGRPVPLLFDTLTFNVDFNGSSAIGDGHLLVYGANVRRNDFELSIAPAADDRNELGAFGQLELDLGEHWRWVLGARVDDLDPIGIVVSPRTSLLLRPTPDHTVRLSFNRAFRAPSAINNALDLGVLNPLSLPTGLFVFPSLATGNPALQEEQVDAVELGYTGRLGEGVIVTAAVYRNELTDTTDFFPSSFYTGANPPPGWPLPPILLDLPPALGGLAGLLPATFGYRNIGEIVDRGLELAIDLQRPSGCHLNASYSFQDTPKVLGIPRELVAGVAREAVNIPPEHRFNLGLGYNGPRYFASGNVNWVDEAFWTDVLDSRFWGPTEAYTQVNLKGGVHLAGGKVTFAVNAQNLLDERVQQHVFGDIITRKLTAEVRLRLGDE